MTLHKLNPERQPPEPRHINVGVSFQHDLYSLADTVVNTRALQAFEMAVTNHPIHRIVRCAVHRKLEQVFDDLALKMNLTAQRLDTGSLLLDGPGAFVSAGGKQKSGYCSCTFTVWAATPARAEEIRESIYRIVGDQRIRDEMFVLDWHFSGPHGSLSSTSFEEIAHDVLHDEAYPELGAPVKDFITRYLDAEETVLILLGQPGSGKTRLVRTILGEMSRRKGDSAEVMYTGDRRALENDEIFVEFITGAHDAFVIEDADHLLTARSSGNQDLHRFLAIADGVVRAQGRKILFTTNLPNVGDIDEALLRPGRCFATVRTRSLTREEGARLVGRLCNGDAARERAALASVFVEGGENSLRGGYISSCTA
jgi:energy-coupling factor transporter ATP-binding protein EcfA2